MSEPADRPGRGDLSPEERAAFERRVKELDGKLDRVREAREAEVAAGQRSAVSSRGMGYGLRMASETERSDSLALWSSFCSFLSSSTSRGRLAPEARE